MNNPKIQKAPNGTTHGMNNLFAEYLRDHEDGTDDRGRLARYVRDNHIPLTSPNFPLWKNYEPAR